MDDSSFDRVTKLFAAGHSRRSAVKMLAGAAAGGIASLLGGAVGAAPRCKRVDQACQTSADCCPGALGNGNVWCAPTSKNGKTCRACPAGTVACDGGCVNTATDAGNCGACGVRCFGGSACVNGACRCPEGEGFVDGACACLPDLVRCDDGRCHECCTVADCSVEPSQDPSCCAGHCVGTRRDENNCGDCGVVCGADSTCDNGRCCGAVNDVCCPSDGDCNPGLVCAGGTCLNCWEDAFPCVIGGTPCCPGLTCKADSDPNGDMRCLA